MRSLILAVLLGLSGSAFAEHGCQDGFVPVNQGNGQGQTCVADYNLPYWNDSSQSATPTEVWVDRWGAIAVNPDNGNVGTIANQSSKRKAKQVALERCGSNCEVEITYYNQCAAIAWGTGRYSVNSAANADEASSRAIESCGRGASDCKVVFTECSLPERTQ